MLKIIINITIILNCNNISQYCCFCLIFGNPLKNFKMYKTLKKNIIQLNIVQVYSFKFTSLFHCLPGNSCLNLHNILVRP